MGIIPAGHLQQLKLCLKGFYFFTIRNVEESLRVYAKSVQLNRISSNALRLSALKKMDKLLTMQNQKLNYQRLHRVQK